MSAEHAASSSAPPTALPFALLKPVVSPAKASCLIIRTLEAHHLDAILRTPRETGGCLALDFETRGDTSDETNSYVVGCAFSDGQTNWYVDFTSDSTAYECLMKTLHREKTPVLAHNVFFDAAWPLRDFGIRLNFVVCTFAAYKLLATEGWAGQQWGLKAAERELLGWPESNDKNLRRWLVENGFVKRPINKALREKLCPDNK